MKKNVIVLIGFLVVMNSGYSQNEKYPTDEEILKVAEKGLSKQLELIKLDDVRYYGFNNENELNSIQLGIPYRVLMLNETFYTSQDTACNDCIVQKTNGLFLYL